MSKEALAKVVQRAISDASFRRQLGSDTAGALRGFDLTPDEVSALRAGDAGRLSTLGVDQRMSKAFVIGGAAAATRMAQSDLSAGSQAAIDDGGEGGRTIIPHDPEAAATADLDGTASNRAASVVNDDPDGFLAANARASDAGMASYPAHGGLAGPSQVAPARAGDDWARAGTAADDSGRAGSARLDDASGASGGARSVNDDPDGFLAANKNADFSGGTAGEGTAFIDESEAYLTKVGYDANQAASAVTDAHDRGGENIVTRIADDNDPSGGTNASEDGGPNISS